MTRLWGARNPNWRGGRTVDPRGYVLVKLPDHPCADCRGYVYEHHLVVESKYGRRIVPPELVHHRDENKTNNDPTNLEIKASTWHHHKEHRIRETGLRDPGEGNPRVACVCGCGEHLNRYDKQGRPRLYINGHNMRDGSRG